MYHSGKDFFADSTPKQDRLPRMGTPANNQLDRNTIGQLGGFIGGSPSYDFKFTNRISRHIKVTMTEDNDDLNKMYAKMESIKEELADEESNGITQSFLLNID